MLQLLHFALGAAVVSSGTTTLSLEEANKHPVLSKLTNLISLESLGTFSDPDQKAQLKYWGDRNSFSRRRLNNCEAEPTIDQALTRVTINEECVPGNGSVHSAEHCEAQASAPVTNFALDTTNLNYQGLCNAASGCTYNSEATKVLIVFKIGSDWVQVGDVGWESRSSQGTVSNTFETLLADAAQLGGNGAACTRYYSYEYSWSQLWTNIQADCAMHPSEAIPHAICPIYIKAEKVNTQCLPTGDNEWRIGAGTRLCPPTQVFQWQPTLRINFSTEIAVQTESYSAQQRGTPPCNPTSSWQAILRTTDVYWDGATGNRIHGWAKVRDEYGASVENVQVRMIIRLGTGDSTQEEQSTCNTLADGTCDVSVDVPQGWFNTNGQNTQVTSVSFSVPALVGAVATTQLPEEMFTPGSTPADAVTIHGINAPVPYQTNGVKATLPKRAMLPGEQFTFNLEAVLPGPSNSIVETWMVVVMYSKNEVTINSQACINFTCLITPRTATTEAHGTVGELSEISFVASGRAPGVEESAVTGPTFGAGANPFDLATLTATLNPGLSAGDEVYFRIDIYEMGSGGVQFAEHNIGQFDDITGSSTPCSGGDTEGQCDTEKASVASLGVVRAAESVPKGIYAVQNESQLFNYARINGEEITSPITVNLINSMSSPTVVTGTSTCESEDGRVLGVQTGTCNAWLNGAEQYGARRVIVDVSYVDGSTTYETEAQYQVLIPHDPDQPVQIAVTSASSSLYAFEKFKELEDGVCKQRYQSTTLSAEATFTYACTGAQTVTQTITNSVVFTSSNTDALEISAAGATGLGNGLVDVVVQNGDTSIGSTQITVTDAVETLIGPDPDRLVVIIQDAVLLYDGFSFCQDKLPENRLGDPNLCATRAGPMALTATTDGTGSPIDEANWEDNCDAFTDLSDGDGARQRCEYVECPDGGCHTLAFERIGGERTVTGQITYEGTAQNVTPQLQISTGDHAGIQADGQTLQGFQNAEVTVGEGFDITINYVNCDNTVVRGTEVLIFPSLPQPTHASVTVGSYCYLASDLSVIEADTDYNKSQEHCEGPRCTNKSVQWRDNPEDSDSWTEDNCSGTFTEDAHYWVAGFCGGASADMGPHATCRTGFFRVTRSDDPASETTIRMEGNVQVLLHKTNNGMDEIITLDGTTIYAALENGSSEAGIVVNTVDGSGSYVSVSLVANAGTNFVGEFDLYVHFNGSRTGVAGYPNASEEVGTEDVQWTVAGTTEPVDHLGDYTNNINPRNDNDDGDMMVLYGGFERPVQQIKNAVAGEMGSGGSATLVLREDAVDALTATTTVQVVKYVAPLGLEAQIGYSYPTNCVGNESTKVVNSETVLKADLVNAIDDTTFTEGDYAYDGGLDGGTTFEVKVSGSETVRTAVAVDGLNVELLNQFGLRQFGQRAGYSGPATFSAGTVQARMTLSNGDIETVPGITWVTTTDLGSGINAFAVDAGALTVVNISNEFTDAADRLGTVKATFGGMGAESRQLQIVKGEELTVQANTMTLSGITNFVGVKDVDTQWATATAHMADGVADCMNLQDIAGFLAFGSGDMTAATVDTGGVVTIVGNMASVTITATAPVPGGAAAGEYQASASISTNLSPALGDVDLGERNGIAFPVRNDFQEFDLEVRVNLGANVLGAIDMQIDYDPATFDIVSASRHSNLFGGSGGDFQASLNSPPGTVHLVAVAPTNWNTVVTMTDFAVLRFAPVTANPTDLPVGVELSGRVYKLLDNDSNGQSEVGNAIGRGANRSFIAGDSDNNIDRRRMAEESQLVPYVESRRRMFAVADCSSAGLPQHILNINADPIQGGIRGNANLDCDLTVGDASYILYFKAGLLSYTAIPPGRDGVQDALEISLLDSDNNGALEVADAAHLLKVLTGKVVFATMGGNSGQAVDRTGATKVLTVRISNKGDQPIVQTTNPRNLDITFIIRTQAAADIVSFSQGEDHACYAGDVCANNGSSDCATRIDRDTAQAQRQNLCDTSGDGAQCAYTDNAPRGDGIPTMPCRSHRSQNDCHNDGINNCEWRRASWIAADEDLPSYYQSTGSDPRNAQRWFRVVPDAVTQTFNGVDNTPLYQVAFSGFTDNDWGEFEVVVATYNQASPPVTANDREYLFDGGAAFMIGDPPTMAPTNPPTLTPTDHPTATVAYRDDEYLTSFEFEVQGAAVNDNGNLPLKINLGFATFMEGPYKFSDPDLAVNPNWGSLASRLTVDPCNVNDNANCGIAISMPSSELTLENDCSIETGSNMSTTYVRVTTTDGNPDPAGFPDNTPVENQVWRHADGTELAAAAKPAMEAADAIISWSHARLACNNAGLELCSVDELRNLRLANNADQRMCSCGWTAGDTNGGRECSPSTMNMSTCSSGAMNNSIGRAHCCMSVCKQDWSLELVTSNWVCDISADYTLTLERECNVEPTAADWNGAIAGLKNTLEAPQPPAMGGTTHADKAEIANNLLYTKQNDCGNFQTIDNEADCLKAARAVGYLQCTDTVSTVLGSATNQHTFQVAGARTCFAAAAAVDGCEDGGGTAVPVPGGAAGGWVPSECSDAGHLTIARAPSATFSVTQAGDSVTVTRTDAATGWDFFVDVTCCVTDGLAEPFNYAASAEGGCYLFLREAEYGWNGSRFALARAGEAYWNAGVNTGPLADDNRTKRICVQPEGTSLGVDILRGARAEIEDYSSKVAVLTRYEAACDPSCNAETDAERLQYLGLSNNARDTLVDVMEALPTPSCDPDNDTRLQGNLEDMDLAFAAGADNACPVDTDIVLVATSGMNDEDGVAQVSPTVVIGQQSYLQIEISKVGITEAGIDVQSISLESAQFSTEGENGDGIVVRNGVGQTIIDYLYANGSQTDKGTFNNVVFAPGNMAAANPTATLQFIIADCTAGSGNESNAGCLDVVPTGVEAWEVNLEVVLEVGYQTVGQRRRRRRLTFKGVSSLGRSSERRTMLEMEGTARTVITQGLRMAPPARSTLPLLPGWTLEDDGTYYNSATNERRTSLEAPLLEGWSFENGLYVDTVTGERYRHSEIASAKVQAAEDTVAAEQESSNNLVVILAIVGAVVAALGLTLVLRMYMKKRQSKQMADRKQMKEMGVMSDSSGDLPQDGNNGHRRRRSLTQPSTNNISQPSQQSRPSRDVQPNSPVFSSSSNEITSYEKVRGDYSKHSHRASNGAARMAAEEHNRQRPPATRTKGHYQGADRSTGPTSSESRPRAPGVLNLDDRETSRVSDVGEDHSSDGESSDPSVVRDGKDGTYRPWKGSPALSTSTGDEKRISPEHRPAMRSFQEA